MQPGICSINAAVPGFSIFNDNQSFRKIGSFFCIIGKFSKKLVKKRTCKKWSSQSKQTIDSCVFSLSYWFLHFGGTISSLPSPNNPNMLSRWKNEAIARLASVFENNAAQKRKEKKEHDRVQGDVGAGVGREDTGGRFVGEVSSHGLYGDDRKGTVDQGAGY